MPVTSGEHQGGSTAGAGKGVKHVQQLGGTMRFHRKSMRSRPVLAATLAVLPLGLVATAPGPVSATPAPITIAYITDVTGAGAAQTGSSPAAFEARLALQNAEGGVHGHKLVPLVIDDQTSPSAIGTAVQDADSKAFGIVSQSPLFFLAAKFPKEAGIPVTGSYDDGPEWGTQPYTNMFASDEGSVDPKYPVNTAIGDFLKAHGGTVIASYGYSISPSSTRAAVATTKSFVHAGGKVGVLDTSVPYGGVDFTAAALVAKQKGVDAMVPAMTASSNYALAKTLKQTGVKLKATLFPTGYEPDVVNSPAWPTLQGDYFFSAFRPWSLPNTGTQQMQSAMEKYAHFTKSQFPTYGQYEAWLGADLMIKGLQMAGPNATHAAVIAALRGLKSYNGNGLLPHPINYATIFGHDLAQTCFWVLKAEKTGFTTVSLNPVCGKDLPGTSTS